MYFWDYHLIWPTYGTLLLLLCEESLGLEGGELIGNLGDVHLYKNHLEQNHEQIKRESYNLPKLNFLIFIY